MYRHGHTFSVVCATDSFLFRFELMEDLDRTKDLLNIQATVVLKVREYGGLNEVVALILGPCATNKSLAVLAANLEIREDIRSLRLVRLGTHLCPVIERVSELQALHSCDYALLELGCDSVLNVDSGRGCTDLSSVLLSELASEHSPALGNRPYQQGKRSAY